MQEDIIKLLEKQTEPLPGKKIANLLNESPEKVFRSLKKLIKAKEVYYKRIEILQARKIKGYEKIKRPMNLYYINLDY